MFTFSTISMRTHLMLEFQSDCDSLDRRHCTLIVSHFTMSPSVTLQPSILCIYTDLLTPLQVILTWFIVGQLVWSDMHKGRFVAPLSPWALGALCACNRSAPPLASHQRQSSIVAVPATRTRVRTWASWWFTEEDLFHPYPPTVVTATQADVARQSGSTLNNGSPTIGDAAAAPLAPGQQQLQPGTVLLQPTPAVPKGRLWGRNCIRSLAWIVPNMVFWALGVGICAAIWGGTNYNHFPQTPLIFTVYGAAIAFFFSPIVALIALTTAGRVIEEGAHAHAMAAASSGSGTGVQNGTPGGGAEEGAMSSSGGGGGGLMQPQNGVPA